MCTHRQVEQILNENWNIKIINYLSSADIVYDVNQFGFGDSGVPTKLVPAVATSLMLTSSDKKLDTRSSAAMQLFQCEWTMRS